MTQLYFPSQVDLTTLDSGCSTYNALMMTKNSEEPDDDILEILLLLHVVPFNNKTARQKINKGAVLKKSISATMALIEGINKAELWRKHNKIGVSILKDLLVTKYSNFLPQKCDVCDKIYQCHDTTDMHKCISCEVGFCPDCCPSDAPANQYFYPLCSPCVKVISNKGTSEITNKVPVNIPEEASTAPPTPTAPVGVQWPVPEEAPTAPPAPTAPVGAQGPGPGRGRLSLSLTPTPAPTPTAGSSPGSPRALGGGKPPSQPPGGPGETPTGSEASDKPSSKVSDKVCGFYAKSCCKFGSKGEGCSYAHPNKCFKWMKRGLAGCSKGADCDYYHVKLCKSAAKGAECTNDKCTLPHVAKLTTTLPGPRVQWPGPGRGEKPIVTTRTLNRDPNTFAKAKANLSKPPQDFQIRRTPEAPDVGIKGLLEAVSLLTRQMGEIMVRLQTPVSAPRTPVLYPHPPPSVQAHQQPTYQAFPYHQHQLQHAVVRMPAQSQ
jgi:hypothetical protein